MSYVLKSLCNNLYVKSQTQLHLAQTSPPPSLPEKKWLHIHHTNTDRICMSWLISVVSDEMRPVPGVPLIESPWIFYTTAQLSHTLKLGVVAPHCASADLWALRDTIYHIKDYIDDDDDDDVIVVCSAAIHVCATIPVPKGSVRWDAPSQMWCLLLKSVAM